jgi:hypothetical protein
MGWDLLSYLSIGVTANSTPADPERDERALCFCEAKLCQRSPRRQIQCLLTKTLRGTIISWNTATATPGRFTFRSMVSKNCCSQLHARVLPLQIGSEPAALTSSTLMIPTKPGFSTKLRLLQQHNNLQVHVPERHNNHGGAEQILWLTAVQRSTGRV